MGIGCESCHSKLKGFFCEVNKKAVDILNTQKQALKFNKGQILYVEGKPAEGIYCIQQGKVKIIKKTCEQKEAIVHLRGPGDITGHYGLFGSNKYLSTATALEDCQVCFIGKNTLKDLMPKHPEITERFIAKLSIEMNEAEKKLSSMINKNVRERLAEQLLNLAHLYGEEKDERIKLEVKLTREEIALMIGTVNETVTRLFTEFKADGMIEEHDKVIYITNKERLMKTARLN